MPLDPEEFARLVSIEMLRLRGWHDLKKVPPEVRGDVHKTMGEDSDYTRMWISGTSPVDAARAIQYRAWDSVNG